MYSTVVGLARSSALRPIRSISVFFFFFFFLLFVALFFCFGLCMSVSVSFPISLPPPPPSPCVPFALTPRSAATGWRRRASSTDTRRHPLTRPLTGAPRQSVSDARAHQNTWRIDCRVSLSEIALSFVADTSRRSPGCVWGVISAFCPPVWPLPVAPTFSLSYSALYSLQARPLLSGVFHSYLLHHWYNYLVPLHVPLSSAGPQSTGCY